MVERKFPRDFIPSLIEEEEEEEYQKYRIHDFQRNFSCHLSATGQNQGDDTAALRTMKETVASS